MLLEIKGRSYDDVDLKVTTRASSVGSVGPDKKVLIYKDYIIVFYKHHYSASERATFTGDFAWMYSEYNEFKGNTARGATQWSIKCDTMGGRWLLIMFDQNNQCLVKRLYKGYNTAETHDGEIILNYETVSGRHFGVSQR